MHCHSTLMIDLHTHTTCSDGTLTPEELVQYAQKKSLCAVAITDHDTVAGNERALTKGALTGVEVVPGVELSAQCEKGTIHILGLFIDFHNTHMKKATETLQKKRRERNIKILNKLREMGIDIKRDSFLENAYLGRPHIARELVASKHCKTIDDAFERFLKRGASAYVEREKLPEKETVEVIVKAGGIPVLAHPVTVYDVEKTVTRLCQYGLSGIEVYYPTHSQEDMQYFQNLAQQHNLLVTGGSDFHGETKPNIDLGCMNVPAHLLDALKSFKGNKKKRNKNKNEVNKIKG